MKRDALKNLIVYYISTILRTYDSMSDIELKRVSTGLSDIVEHHRQETNVEAISNMGRKDLLRD